MSAAELAASLARIGQVQAHLSAPQSVLIAVVALGAALIEGLWLITRHVTVMAHEGAHATVASAVGRKIDGIEFRLNANGATYHSGTAMRSIDSPSHSSATSGPACSALARQRSSAPGTSSLCSGSA
jgi:hypothetical protein